MQKIIGTAIIMSLVVLLAACGGKGAKDSKGELGDMKVKLEKLKKDKAKLDADIHALEDKIAKSDPNAVKIAKLVSVQSVTTQDFTHYIELPGRIDAYDIVNVTPRGTPGQVRELYVKKGDLVKKGQLLVKLDDAVMLQQVDQIKTQLAFAEDLYRRRKNLWDQGIGTEVELTTAKNNVDNLKRSLSTLTETWNTSFVYAPVSGVANEVNVKVGETFTGANQIQLVNNSSLKMVTEIPENYIARVKKGDKVEVVVPETGKPPFQSTISVVGASINPQTRGFTTEAPVPSDPALKPYQLATIRILDYKSTNTIVAPVNTIQTDEKGKYVFVAEKAGDKLVAKKKTVVVGEAYGDSIEIKSGLNNGDQIITEGYQTVYDGQTITTAL